MIQTLVASPGGRRLAFGLSSPRTTWDAWLVDTAAGEPTQLTHSPTVVADDELADATLDRFPSFDGESIPFLTYHPGGSEPAAVLLEIHGGPEAQRRPMWIPLVQYLVGRGLAVVQPNVRGSTGYGKRFEHLDDGRKRLDTVRDVASLPRPSPLGTSTSTPTGRCSRRHVRRLHGAGVPRVRAGGAGQAGVAVVPISGAS